MMQKLIPLLPEFSLLSIALLSLVGGLFLPRFNDINIKISITLILLTAISLFLLPIKPTNIFGNSFYISKFIFSLKSITLVLIFLISLIYLVLGSNYRPISTRSKIAEIEFFILLLFSGIGSCIIFSARDLIILFCSLELQAIIGYSLAAFDRKNSLATEASLKYFVLGAFMSCFMLFGISFVYGFSGKLNFYEISNFLQSNDTINLAFMFGIILIILSCFFKLSAAPFHSWSPDVYSGSPIFSMIFFATIPKITIVIVLINILQYFIFNLDNQIFNFIIKITAIFSLFLGAISALKQTSLKKIMAYSGILNTGFILIALSLFSPEANLYALFYIIIYVISSLVLFLCFIFLFENNIEQATIFTLSHLGYKYKTISLIIVFTLLSMVGIPPFVGFFTKYYVFYSALKGGELVLTTLGVITSCIASYFYLRIIRYIYFVPEDSTAEVVPKAKRRNLLLVICATILLMAILASAVLDLNNNKLFEDILGPLH